MTGVMETDIIFIPEQKNSRSRQICCFFWFARHGRALMGASPEYARIVGSI